MKVCLLGSTGYIGSMVKYYLGMGAVYPERRGLLDFDFSRFSVVINCVGMANQNLCDLHPQYCYDSNVGFPVALCRALPAKTKLIHISSTLSNPTGSWYSKCKHMADEYIKRTRTNYCIYRLPWLFDKDFPAPRVAYSEVGSPSYVKDVITYITNNYNKDKGIIDVANEGVRNRVGWYKDMGFGVEEAVRPYASFSQPVAQGKLRPYEQALKECFNAKG